jgi:threonine synthase
MSQRVPTVPLDPMPFRGSSEVAELPALSAPSPPDAAAPPSQWRYRSALPIPEELAPVSQGEGFVPLEPLALKGLPSGLLALRDDRNPTGSWKDRGSSVLVSALAAAGVEEIVEDSSGNAAVSLARYAEQAGIALTAFVPDSARPLKKELIRAEGADVVEVPGPRPEATRAARAAANSGAFWASHSGQPLHALGAATAAFNVAELLGRAPGTVVMPLGQGGLLAGVARGFEALEASGFGQRPALVGVQSSLCAPLATAFSRGSETASAADPPDRAGLAEGVLIPHPARGREVLAAVRSSGGTIESVDDMAVDRALRLLWLAGFKVEPTSALPVAWLLARARRGALPTREPIVVILTGHGIRAGRSLVEGLEL